MICFSLLVYSKISPPPFVHFPPPLVIGREYGYALDMWALGCTIFELYTGRILFQGKDNNQMLRDILQV